MKQNEILFKICEFSTDKHLTAALKSENGLVRSSAQEEIDRRAALIQAEERRQDIASRGVKKLERLKRGRPKKEANSPRKRSRPAKTPTLASQATLSCAVDECLA